MPSNRSDIRIFLVFFVATLVQGTARFLYDAQYYWLAAQRAIGSIDRVPSDLFETRGVLTAIVYSPAALAARVLGDDIAGAAVLAQNAAFLAAFAAFGLPRLIGSGSPHSTHMKAAFLTWFAVAGFAPYPLVDIYAAVACILVVVLIRSARPSTLAVAGLIGGVAVNVRPAYLITLGLLGLLALLRHRTAALLMAAGAILALLPQVIFNRVRYHTISLLPPASDALVKLQVGLGSYIIRYDTLFANPSPQRFYCSPSMAARVGTPPDSLWGFAAVMLSNMPTSLRFALEKIGAALHWQVSNPYTVPAPRLSAFYAIAVTVATCVGIAAFIRSRNVAVIIVAAATIGTLISGATETRFALVVVMLGIAGCCTVRSLKDRWVLIPALVAVIIVAFGYSGLAHPAPATGFDPTTCATAT
jgi:hypothetical protein